MLYYWIYLILVLCILYYMSVSSKNTMNSTQTGGSTLPSGLSRPFSNYKVNSQKGNPISWEGTPNCPDPRRLSHPLYLSGTQPTHHVTFWGHGIPLVHETQPAHTEQQLPTEREFRRTTLSGSNLVCHPSCCPSPYSCDRGCVCYARDVKGFRYDGAWGKPSYAST